MTPSDPAPIANTRALVIGYGSIGARHSRLLSEMGVEVACVTRNKDCPFPRYTNTASAIQSWLPTHIVVANATGMHAETIDSIESTAFRGSVLVEKPLFGGSRREPPPRSLDISVAYNLRFHPLVQRVRKLVQHTQLYSATFQAGQYLPDWRPGRDYSQNYSARAAMGGGVLRDLSHELDLALLLCGPIERIAAVCGHFSNLAGDSDDVASLLAVGARCSVINIDLNYLNRPPRRSFTLNGRELSVHLDLVEGVLSVNGENYEEKIDRDETYRSQLKAFLIGDRADLCSASEALAVEALIVATEHAAHTGAWTAASNI